MNGCVFVNNFNIVGFKIFYMFMWVMVCGFNEFDIIVNNGFVVFCIGWWCY